jgi:hypothetical protein
MAEVLASQGGIASRAVTANLTIWIPAFAGMSEESLGLLAKGEGKRGRAIRRAAC